MVRQITAWFLAAAGTALFAFAAGAGVWRLFTRPAGQAAAGMDARPDRRGQLLAAGGALAWAAAVLALLCTAAVAQSPGTAPLDAVRDSLCGGLDARHYLDLARWGYGAAEQDFAEQYLMIVFFPLWPWLLRPFALLGADLWLAGTGLAVALTTAGTVLLYRCAYRLFGDGRTSGFACLLQLLMPGSFFFVLPQTEALFFCLNFAFLDAMQRDKPVQAGAFGLLAALCRANGVLLAGYAVVWCILALRRGARPHGSWLLPVAGPAVGIAVYLGINWAVYGNAFQFAVYQREHWNHSFCLFPQAIAIMSRYIGADSTGIWLGLWTVVLILLELLLLAAACLRLSVDWLLLGLAGVAMMNGQTWLISAQRYALGMPALAPAAAGLVRRSWQRMLLAVGMAVLWAVYAIAFLSHAPIY